MPVLLLVVRLAFRKEDGIMYLGVGLNVSVNQDRTGNTQLQSGWKAQI